jgi:hypothetical protein
MCYRWTRWTPREAWRSADMSIAALIERTAQSAGCHVHLPIAVPRGLALPDDLAEFYRRCAGVDLFLDRDYAVSLLGPADLQPSNAVILAEQYPDDITATWYTIGRTPDSDYLSIDLAPERLGRCYDSFYELHGVAGSCPIIATGFTDLYRGLLDGAGDRWYWQRPGFVELGDAYD